MKTSTNVKIAVFSVSFALLAGAAEANQAGVPTNFRFDRSALSTDAGAAAVLDRMYAHAKTKCDPRGDYLVTAREACAQDLVGQWVLETGDDRLIELNRSLR